MAIEKVYHNNAWEGTSGKWQTNEVSSTRSFSNDSQPVTLNTITKPSWAKYGIMTARANVTCSAAGTVRLSLGNLSCDFYAQDQYSKWFSISAVYSDDAVFSISSGYKTGSVGTSTLRVIWI